MGFIATSGGGNFKQVPPGSYVARCYSLIDLGTQVSEKFGTAAHKIKISWELFGEDSDGQPLTIERDGKTVPMTVSADYTVSLNEKANLRRVLESWRGRAFTAEEAKGFDISKLIGSYCMLSVTSSESANGKTYSNVAGVSQLPSALKANKPAPVHANVLFSLDEPDMKLFSGFHEKLQERIKSTPEWQKHMKGRSAAAPVEADVEDETSDVPFISASAAMDMESRFDRRIRRMKGL